MKNNIKSVFISFFLHSLLLFICVKYAVESNITPKKIYHIKIVKKPPSKSLNTEIKKSEPEVKNSNKAKAVKREKAEVTNLNDNKKIIPPGRKQENKKPKKARAKIIDTALKGSNNIDIDAILKEEQPEPTQQEEEVIKSAIESCRNLTLYKGIDGIENIILVMRIHIARDKTIKYRPEIVEYKCDLSSDICNLILENEVSTVLRVKKFDKLEDKRFNIWRQVKIRCIINKL